MDPVDAQGLGDDLVDGLTWVERPHRILEHHLHATSELPDVPNRLSLEQDLAALWREKTHDRPGRRRLPAPGLAREREHLASAKVEARTVDGARVAPLLAEEASDDTDAALEDDRQVADLQYDVLDSPRLLDDAHSTAPGASTSAPSTSRHAARRPSPAG